MLKLGWIVSWSDIILLRHEGIDLHELPYLNVDLSQNILDRRD
jgi:hypothetical protein